MLLLALYVFIALFFSFLCSIAEAVLLSVTRVYITVLENEGRQSGFILNQLKADINKPLTAILTLNTVAHTIGAAGVGAQATVVFGSSSLGVVSAVLTVLILIFSEVIPKTLGATHWKALAPATAWCLKFMIWLLYPFVRMSEVITRKIVKHQESEGLQRDEFAILAQLSAGEGHIDPDEANILQNLMLLKQTKVIDAVTPSSVMFTVSQQLQVSTFFHKYQKVRFTRVPVYADDPDDIIGYVLRSDLLLAQARGNGSNTLSNYIRKMPTLLETMTLSHAMHEIASGKSHIALVVNEYGTLRGLLTLEDIFESLIGKEIVDEEDKHVDMQKFAQKQWKNKARKYGIKFDDKP